jgi:hypothetical protein
MSAAADSQRLAVGQVRELLVVDRFRAGETRRPELQLQRSLRTAAFSQPLHVRVRRRWRLDRGLRRRVAWIGFLLALVLALVAWQFVLGVQRPVRAATQEPSSRQDLSSLAPVPLRPVDDLRRPQQERAHSTVPSVRASPQMVPAVTDSPSPRIRLQRGDLWLRISGARAAQRARELLESGLRELPDHGHGQGALAEACLRLGDESCARRAIERAIEARPQRSKFRQLSRDIEQQFASQGASPAP